MRSQRGQRRGHRRAPIAAPGWRRRGNVGNLSDRLDRTPWLPNRRRRRADQPRAGRLAGGVGHKQQVSEENSMSYFVTGGTGFIGRNLIDQLLKRRGTVYVLVRRGSKKKFNALVAERWNESKKRVVAVSGDLTRARLGVSKADREKLAGKIKHVFHLAAVYDLAATAE